MKRLLATLVATTVLTISFPASSYAQGCVIADNPGETWGNCEECDEYSIDINVWMPDPNGAGVQDMKTALEQAVQEMNDCLRDGKFGPILDVDISSNPNAGEVHVHMYPWTSGNDCGVNTGRAGNGDSLIRLYSDADNSECPANDFTTALHELVHSMGHGAHANCRMPLCTILPRGHFSDVPGDVCAAIARQWVSPQRPGENGEPGPISPLVLDVDGNGITTSSLYHDPVYFDLDGDGLPEQTGWTGRGTRDAFLWIDLNRDGIPNSGAELFGNASVLPGGQQARTGIEALAVYDSNGDNKITPEDDVWLRLMVWNDRDHSATAQRSELRRIARTNIVGFSLEARPRRWTDENGNIHTHATTYWTLRAGGQLQPRLMEDIWFLATTMPEGGRIR